MSQHVYSKPGSAPKEHLGELDLLRFGAALSVLLFHYAFRGGASGGLMPFQYEPLAGLMKYGYLGVDLFFMISGFVIMLSAQHGMLSQFLIARVARLYPAFWLCSAITFAVILASGTTIFPNSWNAFFANLTMMPGSLGVPYLDGSYWSLGVELKFYILVALIIALGQIRHAERLVYAWIAITVIASFYPLPFLQSKLNLKFAPYFAAGAIFYFMRQHGQSPWRWLALAVTWFLALDRATTAAADQVAAYNVEHSAVVVCFATTAFYVMFAAIALRKTGALAGKRWPLLGAMTYPLYLIHQTIGYILMSAGYGTFNEHVLFWGMVALSLAAAYLIAEYCEPPLMRQMKAFLSRVFSHVPILRASTGRAR